jgi:hypothetical protein
MNGNNQRRTPIEHEEGNDERNEQDAFDEVVEHRMGGIFDEVFAVVKGDQLGVGGENGVVETRHFIFYPLDDPVGVFAFPHQHDSLDGIGIIAKAAMAGTIDGIGPLHFAETRQVADTDFCDVFDKNGRAVVYLNYDIPDLVDIVQQPDSPDDIGLGVLFDDVAADVNVAFADGVEYVKRRDAEVGQHHRVDLDLVSLDHTAETDHVGNAGDGA